MYDDNMHDVCLIYVEDVVFVFKCQHNLQDTLFHGLTTAPRPLKPFSAII
jgi:hypothetical protein